MKSLLLFAMGVFVSTAWPAQEFVPIQEKAQGQSLSGSNQLNDSLYSNPAASAFVNVYALDGSMNLPKSFAVSLLDTRTSEAGGALGYFRREADSNYFAPGVTAPTSGSKFVQGAKLAFMGKVSEQVAIGAAGKTVWGPNIKGEQTRMNDGDIGILYNAGMFELGFTTRNILGGDPFMNATREFSMGGRICYDQILSLSVATQSTWKDKSPYQYGIGAEFMSPYYFAIRGGYRILTKEDFYTPTTGWTRSNKSKTFWGLGASFVSPKFSVHYAAEIPNQASASVEHVLGTTILF